MCYILWTDSKYLIKRLIEESMYLDKTEYLEINPIFLNIKNDNKKKIVPKKTYKEKKRRTIIKQPKR